MNGVKLPLGLLAEARRRPCSVTDCPQTIEVPPFCLFHFNVWQDVGEAKFRENYGFSAHEALQDLIESLGAPPAKKKEPKKPEPTLYIRDCKCGGSHRISPFNITNGKAWCRVIKEEFTLRGDKLAKTEYV